MKKVVSILIILALLATTLPLYVGTTSALSYPPAQRSPSVQTIIDFAEENSTVIVPKGIHYGPIYINKTIRFHSGTDSGEEPINLW